jgi:hypothetical protein
MSAFDSKADIGAIVDTSGTAPVVIKSLAFPSSACLGKDWQSERKAAGIATRT